MTKIFFINFVIRAHRYIHSLRCSNYCLYLRDLPLFTEKKFADYEYHSLFAKKKLQTRVSDPHFLADPDPGKNFHADPVPDPDPGGIRGRGLRVKEKMIFF